jgi:TonB family protein
LGANPTASILNNAGFYLTECGKENALAESYVRGALDQMKSQRVPAGGRSMSSAISFQGSYSTYLDTYGWLLFKQDQNERAIAALTAAVSLAPRAKIYAHLAQAEWKAGLEKQAVPHWREATFLEPGQISSVPAEIAAQLKSLAPVSLDQVWYPLPGDFPAQVVDGMRSEQPLYFFVTANADGAVESARELSSEDEAAPTLLPAVRAISFPVAQFDGVRLATVNLVKVVKQTDGKVMAARSVAPGAVAIATDLAPDEFPLPAPTDGGPSPAGAASANKLPGGITKPRLLQKTSPQYSEEARRARLEGTVVLQIVIGIDGKPGSFQVVRPLGLGLEEEAIRSVQDWQFTPAQKDGIAVASTSANEVNFQLLKDGSTRMPWHARRVEFGLPQNATRPMLIQGAEPKGSTSPGNATATVTFDIKKDGATSNPVLQKASDEDWAKDVLAVAAKLKFRPSLQDGVPVAATCTIEFVRGK